MSKKNLLEILIVIVSAIVIVISLLNQTGIAQKVNDMKKSQKLAEENRSWQSEAVGDMKLFLEVYDYTDNEELGGNLIGFIAKSQEHDMFSTSDIYLTARDIRKMSYKKVSLANMFQPVEDGKFSKFNYYLMILPLTCDYVKVGNKKIETCIGEIDTKNKGKVKFNICLFVNDKDVDVYEKGNIVFHDKSGKEYIYGDY